MADERQRVRHPGGGRKMTKQSETPSTDINAIVDKYVRTGVLPQDGRTPRYGDFSSGASFHDALTAVRDAETEFMNLNPHVRKVCDNDPGKFLDLVQTPEGRALLDGQGMTEEFAPPGAAKAPEPNSEGPTEGPPADPLPSE